MSNEQIDIASKDLWDRTKTICIGTLPSEEDKHQAERYFSMITSVSLSADHFVIFTSNKFAADQLSAKYLERLHNCLALAGGTNVKLEFKVDEKAKPAIIVPDAPKSASAAATTDAHNSSEFVSTLPLNPDYTFDNFVCGPSNSWANAAAKGVVSNPGQVGYNPLFIHGGTGLGKTHLMQAIGNELKRRQPTLRICYLTAETFLNEYVNALQNGKIKTFRDRYRSVDLLLVDDVQFFQKGKMCQEEFFNTFNALRDDKKQIVMTSDVAPKNLPALEERLISRFEGGIVQEIELPSYETRLAILQKKATLLPSKIPEYAIKFIAENIKSHVRAIEGALGKINIYLMADPRAPMDNKILAYLLKDFIDNEQKLKKITIEEIQATVARKYGITINQILSAERNQSLVTPRQLAMYIARKLTPMSLPEIARKFDKSHATILHGVTNIKKRLDVEDDLKQSLEEILSEFGYKLSDAID